MINLSKPSSKCSNTKAKRIDKTFKEVLCQMRVSRKIHESLVLSCQLDGICTNDLNQLLFKLTYYCKFRLKILRLC